MYLTIPNFLTLLRILAIPVFAICVWYGQLITACILFGMAGLTDVLDGFIARRFNQFSALGAFLDPTADKLLMTVAFVLLCIPGSHLSLTIPFWVAILAITRDVIIGLVAFLSSSGYDPSRFKPSLLGKITTGAELIVISLVLLCNAGYSTAWVEILFPLSFHIVACLVIASGLHYFIRATGAQKKYDGR
ncbi:MAG: CDP-alcohol phosphatidyltransferase family protein [Holophagaceae bacterium]|jgi:cardiolipin synthase|nr:CDP-alcohol phosphatidyltransferase family protein [Holophagaceae bacterium]